jgi:hypothetical protein
MEQNNNALERKKRGRPFKPPEIPPEKITELASICCTNEEIAQICGFSEDTLMRNYAELVKNGKAHTHANLRRRQFEILGTNTPQAATMAIWLGKQILGQSDKTESREERNMSITVHYEVIQRTAQPVIDVKPSEQITDAS